MIAVRSLDVSTKKDYIFMILEYILKI